MVHRLTAQLALSFFVAVAGVSCATTAGYEEVLNSWVGSDISMLIESWGPPSQTYNLPDGRTMYTWDTSSGAVAAPAGRFAVAVPRGCTTTFTVDDIGIVQSWRYEGNSCRS